MCDCIKSVESKLQERFEQEVAQLKGEKITEAVTFENKTISLDIGKWILIFPAIGRYAQGKVSRKWETSVSFSFCPLCVDNDIRQLDEAPQTPAE